MPCPLADILFVAEEGGGMRWRALLQVLGALSATRSPAEAAPCPPSGVAGTGSEETRGRFLFEAPLHSEHVPRGTPCLQLHSLQALRCLLCAQMALPLHSLQSRRILLCTQMPTPPHSMQ